MNTKIIHPRFIIQSEQIRYEKRTYWLMEYLNNRYIDRFDLGVVFSSGMADKLLKKSNKKANVWRI